MVLKKVQPLYIGVYEPLFAFAKLSNILMEETFPVILSYKQPAGFSATNRGRLHQQAPWPQFLLLHITLFTDKTNSRPHVIQSETSSGRQIGR